MENILVIEDRDSLRQVYVDFLKAKGFWVRDAANIREARKALEKQEFALILSDYMLPGGEDGLSFLKELKQQDQDHNVIIMTAFGEVKLAVDAIRSGAFDFLEKPIDLDHLLITVNRALDHRRLRRDNEFQKTRAKGAGKVAIVGESAVLKMALKMATKVAPSDTNCLLLGESGVGKELFARHVHDHSGRANGPMVSINCASIPHELIESELFGHEKGAFTGAVRRKLGLMEAADGGTVFLDEIGEMPVELQPKLLRFIQSREFFRVGGNRMIKSDVRLVCATNRDLKAGVREGWFREDLYFRLAVFPIEIPPLRERKDDLRALISWFLERDGAPTINPDLYERLKSYHWPGNVRELENVLERALILSHGKVLEEQHFPEEIFQGQDFVNMKVRISPDRTLKENLANLESQLEERLIKVALVEEKGNRERVAQRLGVSVKTLYNKIQAHSIDIS